MITSLKPAIQPQENEPQQQPDPMQMLAMLNQVLGQMPAGAIDPEPEEEPPLPAFMYG
eukprot:CAMPEP_0168535732 /NCGR_PEP_ID=MMETSP0405-20121227/18959_1 /TAXON_ID=498012 /ORGANISM="Trichosphaerium sp, Strain Am-I-7 wt" /LENGTH=57 /DNA_ID=CAMNT_0008563263 /DNA_START=29 /DNA_END=202 /DNA_ORIENTATION=+